jgi:hypothetical protein
LAKVFETKKIDRCRFKFKGGFGSAESMGENLYSRLGARGANPANNLGDRFLLVRPQMGKRPAVPSLTHIEH